MAFISSYFVPNINSVRSRRSSSTLRSKKRARNSRSSFRRTLVSQIPWTSPPDAAPLERSPDTLTDTTTDTDSAFSWTESWYPICIVRDAPADSPLALTLFDIPLVLFRESPGEWAVLADRCSHRLAPLSEGRITTSADGLQELECAYHGWSFNGCGSCTRIPQLDSGASIPRNAAVRRYPTRVEFGVIWVYLGAEANAAAKKLPIPDVVYSKFKAEVLSRPSSTYSRYLPYSLEMFIENTTDPEHTHFAHHGAAKMFNRKGGGIRQVTASPFNNNTEDNSNGSISAKINLVNGGFIPPCTTFYNVSIPGIAETASLFMAIPVTRATSRTFVVTFAQFVTTGEKKVSFFVPIVRKLKPVWADHLHKNTILDGDNVFLQKIQERLGNPPNWKGSYLTMKKTDDWIIQVRKFFDMYRDDMPWNSPQPTEPAVKVDRELLLERYHSQTKHCIISSGAYKGFSRAAVVCSLIAKVAITALVSVLVSAYLGNPAVLTGERMRAVRNAVSLLSAVIVVALGLQKKLTWYKQQFVRSDEARRRLLST